MIDEKNIEEKTGLDEKLKSVGQIIVGEIETIGGILTADPITQAEGEFNVEAGTIRQESIEALEEAEEAEDENSNQIR